MEGKTNTLGKKITLNMITLAKMVKDVNIT